MKKYYKFSLILLLTVVATGCATRPPMPVTQEYKLLDNHSSCDCNYFVMGDNLIRGNKVSWGGKSESYDMYAADGNTLLTSGISHDEFEKLIENQKIAGELSESDANFNITIGQKNYVFELPIDEYPELFDTGFVFGSLNFINAIDTENYVFVLLQKPGTVIGFRFNKKTSQADKKFFQDSYPHKNAFGQILSFLTPNVSDTDLVIKGTLIFDKTSTNIILGYSEINTTSSSRAFEMEPGSQWLKVYNSQGDEISDFTNPDINAYFHALQLHGDMLIDVYSGVALNKNTGFKVSVENIENIGGMTSKGILYFDRASKNYYFRNDI
ncbi:MAG: hypothetical protein OCD76_21965 [Reichenbachiella sp.]